MVVSTYDDIPSEPAVFESAEKETGETANHTEKTHHGEDKQKIVEGRVWYIKEDNIDTDMIFHNRYLAITKIEEMGQYIFDNLEGYENFAKKCKKGDIVLVQ